MKALKKVTSCILAFVMLVSLLPLAAFADDESTYSITNGYLTYTFHADTGGFSIETAEGNPKKALDNDMPLLYKEDRGRSNGTSFVTVRINDRDYIFGQDYQSFFKVPTELGTPVVSEEGRLITIPWTVDGVTVTQKVALGTDIDQNTTANAGISFSVENKSGETKNVSIRLLLDTALGNDVDAPYFVTDEEIRPTLCETEFIGDDVPHQIRCVDSLSDPSKLAYILSERWNNGEMPNRVILGHWANLANTRYLYTPDEYCDFTNYSNQHQIPDSAAALYWEGKTLAAGEGFTAETLYGVGNFSKNNNEAIDINITAGRVELAEDGKSYKNDGLITVTVDIDNTVDKAVPLMGAQMNLKWDDSQFELVEGTAITGFVQIDKEVITKQFKLKAKPQNDLTAGGIFVSFTASDTTEEQNQVDTAAQRYVILPSVTGSLPQVQMNKINPQIVYTEGQKSVTVSGSMKPFSALSGSELWDLYLVHEKTGEEVLIEKKNISFLNEAYTNMSFSTDAELTVGKYNLVFRFRDAQLQKDFGKEIAATVQLEASADPKYKQRSYGTIALVRMDDQYDFFTFDDEGEYLQFYQGKLEKTGEYGQTALQYDFGKNKEAIGKNEILLTVRGNLKQMTRENGNKEVYWQAKAADGDIIINNMLAYEGAKPLEIYKETDSLLNKDAFIIKGDGLIKVVNSINVWRSKWSFKAVNGIYSTLDTERFGEATSKKGESVNLSLDGAAVMLQAVGGFMFDLKYGVMSAEWCDAEDGMVKYGIGFGGKMSLPIKAKKNEKKEQDLTADQEDMSEALNNLFDESLTADAPDYSGELQSMFDETPANTKTTQNGKKLQKDTNLSEGKLAVEIENVLFGEKGDVDENKKLVIDDTGYVGINAKVELALPKDLLGSFVTNSPGLYASVTINTIENQYEIGAGVNIKVIECEGVLAFKEVKVKNKEVILPDKVEFYIRQGLMIPLAPPVLYMTGLGGGINGLADSISGDFEKLPPVTILLFTRLEAIETLIGDFNAKASLEGLSLTGDMKLKYAKGFLELNAGISARWIEPWELNLYGRVSIIDGLIKGGITINIADDYFYGYIFASICIPDSIPLVGGKELAGVEAAASKQFVGANIKIIGIRFGVIYYWGDTVSFGKNIDLSAPSKSGEDTLSLSEAGDDEVMAYYGTNIHALAVTALPASFDLTETYREAKVNVQTAKDQDALLLEIPYTGAGQPNASEITLVNPEGREIAAVEPDEARGIEGNFLLQSRSDGRFIYFTVTDKALIRNGDWTVRYTNNDITIETFLMNGVDTIPELTGVDVKTTSDAFKVDTSWTINGDAPEGSLDVYVTEDKDILEKMKTENNTGASPGINILHVTDPTAIAKGKMTAELPEALPGGTYYTVALLSTSEGISTAISPTAFAFTNPNLPQAVKSVKATYGGNGTLVVSAEDADNANYTHYIAEIEAEDGTILNNNLDQFAKGSTLMFGKEAQLEANKAYRVNIKTLREEYRAAKAGSNEDAKTMYFYSEETKSSDWVTIPERVIPKLTEVKTSYDATKEFIADRDVTVEYTFDTPVFMELKLRGQKVYTTPLEEEGAQGKWFRKYWRFDLEDLEDGDYVVDFTAYAENKDSVTGADAAAYEPNAQLGFTIDTSAPVLSLAQQGGDSLAKNEDGTAIRAMFGANTVFADEAGRYTVRGITEKAADLTANDSTDGVSVASNGSFTVTGTLAEGENYKQITLRAVDKAGNIATLLVHVLRSGSTAFTKIEILKDGTAVTPDADGVKVIQARNGSQMALSVVGITESGQQIPLSGDAFDWNVLYEKNLIAFNAGNVRALAPGETAVRAKLNTMRMTTANDVQILAGLTDFVTLQIDSNNVNDLADKIEEAEEVLAGEPTASDERKNTLQDAINEARTVLSDTGATEKELTDAVSKLDAAIKAFQKGDKPSGGGSGVRKHYYTVSVTTEGKGSAKLSHNLVTKGTSVTVTATPDEGYFIFDILVNGASIGREAVSTIRSIEENTEIRVIFKEESALPFTDVAEDDWFNQNVTYVWKNGLMNGVSDMLFAPNGLLTRGMLVTVLYRAEGEPQAAQEAAFGDVARDAYYKKAVDWAAENGIVMGISDTAFAPNDNITREQIAAILHRYAKHKGYDVSVGEDTNILSYSDYESISEYAIEALQWTAGSGIMSGRTDSTLDPKENATRAETAAVLQRLLEKYGQQ